MATILLGLTLAVLDSAIANVALPTIARDLAVGPAEAIWVVNAYQLTIMVLLLPLSSYGEIVGYRRVYRVGVALFVVASVGCALAGSIWELTAARVLQGVGAAGIMSVNPALVRFTYPRATLGRGIGFNALVVGVASALGPTVAAGILALGPWQWLFAINVPIGLAVLAASRALPKTPPVAQPFDLASALLSACTFGLFIVALDGLGHGANRPAMLGVLAVSVVAGIVLVRRQLARPRPLLPVDLLRRPIFALSLCTSIGAFMAQMLAYVALPFHLQHGLGRDAVATGLLMTPWPLATAVASPIAGWLADRYPAAILGAVGLVLFGTGLGLLALMPGVPSDADIAWRMALAGLGFGLFQSPNNRTILGSAPADRAGGAGGMLGTARLLGQTTGAALVAFAFGVAPDSATQWSLLGAAIVAVVAAGISSLRLVDRKGLTF